MKRILFFGLIVTILSSCGNSGNGELIGTQDRDIWQPVDPYGMVFIPQGSFVMGPSDQDVPFANVTAAKTVSVGAFYMDETEITNNEYRQFTNWVRDSILSTYLIEFNPDEYGIEKADDLGEFNGEYRIDWKQKIRWDDEEVREILSENMYLPEDERFNGKREIDTRKLIYVYQELDLKKAARKANREGNNAPFFRDRNDLINDITVDIYPDTLAWMHDYAYSFNEPMTDEYFWHPAFDDYPVVGINWNQAVAFTTWRTQMMNGYLKRNNELTLPDFRLPTESEWEYAARGGADLSPYPWGGPYTRNHKGCFLANFKPLRGNYTADGGLRSVKVASYNPNAYGLYDMAGNVSEWTSNTFDESAFSYAHDMNMDYTLNTEDSDSEVLKRKVIRGGSWKDISYFIEVSTRDYEYQDTAKCYIGFRCAVDFLGRDKKDFE